MNVFSKLLRFFRGNQQEKSDVIRISQSTVDDYLARWETERQERMQAAEVRLKDWLVSLLKKEGNLTFSWESGNDEAFVTVKHKEATEEENVEDLEEYLIDKLEIPDAGEFRMDGRGTIYIEGNFVRAKYSSVMKGVIDYNEETEEEIFSEEVEDKGDRILFQIQ